MLYTKVLPVVSISAFTVNITNQLISYSSFVKKSLSDRGDKIAEWRLSLILLLLFCFFFSSDTIRFFQYQKCQALVYCWVALQWLDRDSDLQSCFKRIHSEPCWYYFRFNLNSNRIKERKKLDYSSSFAGAWLAEEGFCIRQYFGINSALAASQTRHHLSLWDLRC